MGKLTLENLLGLVSENNNHIHCKKCGRVIKVGFTFFYNPKEYDKYCEFCKNKIVEESFKNPDMTDWDNTQDTSQTIR